MCSILGVLTSTRLCNGDPPAALLKDYFGVAM